MKLSAIQKQHGNWLKRVGWFKNKTPLESIALIASEIGEAANECRGEGPTPKLGLELADIILRTCGLAEELNIDLEKMVSIKMKINKVRGNRGRKK